ncbi:MAG: succinate dehydrogenase and fumarate reductase iron-sulfur protein [Verrucomicrobiales bacterium]|nr:succinate dehydrogenase and fumarate reductase iron-sulfur protein [Verrucomicrobiales bacterium]
MPKVTLSVARFAPETDQTPRFEEYQVDVSAKASVLDALFALQRGATPDLAFRFSCRVGMCGSCAMVVNGREQLTCSTLVKDVGTHLRIEPLRNLPVVRDLAVELKPFFDSYNRTLPYFTPRPELDQNEFYRMPHSSKEWKALNHQPQCIDCGACYSSCTLVTLNKRYVGPMALNRALTLMVDPRDGRHEERLAIVSGESGAFRCHTLGSCRDVCPRGISPTHSIERLKRLSFFDGMRSIFSGFLSDKRK